MMHARSALHASGTMFVSPTVTGQCTLVNFIPQRETAWALLHALAVLLAK